MSKILVAALTVVAMSTTAVGVEQASARSQGKGAFKPVPTMATFTPGGDIGDDGEGSYIDGDAGLRATIEQTGQWAMNLKYYKFNGTRREAYIDLTTPADGTSPKLGVHQTSAFYISVFAIAQMEEGKTKLTGANGFFVEGKKTYWFWFTTSNGHTGNEIRITRVNATQWVVEALPGTVAQVTDGLSSHVGNYEVAFTLTIDKL